MMRKILSLYKNDFQRYLSTTFEILPNRHDFERDQVINLDILQLFKEFPKADIFKEKKYGGNTARELSLQINSYHYDDVSQNMKEMVYLSDGDTDFIDIVIGVSQ